MTASAFDFARGLAAAAADFTVELAETPRALREAYRLRHQVYCIERGFEDDRGEFETDEYDVNAPHVVVRRRLDREVVGTVRLVMPRHAAPGSGGLPMQHLCPDVLAPHLRRGRTAEISRFALSRDRRGASTEATLVLRVALMQGIVRLSSLYGITQWCALMERGLLRLLRTTSIHFDQIGPAVHHHGPRHPSVAAIDTVLARLRREQPCIWNFVTGRGVWWTDAAWANRAVALAA